MKLTGGNISLAAASVLSKMIDDSAIKKSSGSKKIEIGTLENIAHSLIKKQDMMTDLLMVLPDLEFCEDTATASIISPNDLTTKSLQYDFENIVLGGELKGTLSEVIKKDLQTYYKIEDTITDTVKMSHFRIGADIEAYIPEASLSEVISDKKDKNSGTDSKGYGEISIESAISTIKNATSIGIFKDNKIDLADVTAAMKTFEEKVGAKKVRGKAKTELNTKVWSAETLTTESGIKGDSKSLDVTKILGVEFVDNLADIYISDLTNKEKINRVENLYTSKSKLQNESGLDKETLEKLFINQNSYGGQDTVYIKEYNDTDRESVGRPLIKKIPIEAMKPIWSGTPDNHIGYIGLLDENSNFVTQTENKTIGGNGTSPAIYFTNNVNMKENLINKALEGLTNMTTKLPELEYIHEIYSDILHNTIVKKIKSGKLNEVGEYSKDQKFLNIMFDRALAGKKTKIIFLPASVVSYFAYDFHPNGVGRSRMDKIQVILSMRVILLFANIMANLNNSIPRTTITGVLDKNTPDIVKAMNDIIVGSAKYHQSSLPLGATNVNDLLGWVQTAGYRYVFESDKLPDTKISYEEGNRNIRLPEDGIKELLASLSYMAYYMNTAMVISGAEAAYATTIVSQNKLFENRIVSVQVKTEQLYTERVRKILNNDAVLRNKIKNAININLSKIKNLNKELLKEMEQDNSKRENVVNFLLEKFISGIVVRLPRPTSYNEGDNLSKNFTEMSDVVDKAIEGYLQEDATSAEIIGEKTSERIKEVKEKLKQQLKFEWLVANNHLPALSEFLTVDEDGASNNDLLSKHSSTMKTLAKLVAKHYEESEKDKKENEETFEKIEEKLGVGNEGDNPPEEEEEEEDNSGGSGEDKIDDFDEEEEQEPKGDEDEKEEEEEDKSTEKNNPEEDEE